MPRIILTPIKRCRIKPPYAPPYYRSMNSHFQLSLMMKSMHWVLAFTTSRNPFPTSNLSNRSSHPRLITQLQVSLFLAGLYITFILKLHHLYIMSSRIFLMRSSTRGVTRTNIFTQNSFFWLFSWGKFGNIHNFDHFRIFEPHLWHFSIFINQNESHWPAVASTQASLFFRYF